MKTRFAKFYNLPELMCMFKESADIQTADMLKLPVPALKTGKPINISLKPSEVQKEMVKALGERAEAVRKGEKEPYEDNMLNITNDGRKLALDQRLMNPLLPDDPNSKVNACVENVLKIWQETAPQRSTQLIFCDLSTPNTGFNVYDDIKEKLIMRGVPEDEIQFIHNANTEARKAELFGKVRSGSVRILLGSTSKMGAGTNVQRKLIALHHLDVPWRPSDMEQREGRMVRQGNENEEVSIYRYVTEGTFDAYSYQLVENKQKFISQVMTSRSPNRSCDDVDEAALSYAEVKALAAGNPAIKEKMDLDVQVARLRTLKSMYQSQHYDLEDAVTLKYPRAIQETKGKIANAKADAARVVEHTRLDSDGKEIFSITLDGKAYDEKEPAGKALLGLLGAAMNTEKPPEVGSYKGFSLQISYNPMEQQFLALLVGNAAHSTPLGADAVGNLTRLNNALKAIEPSVSRYEQELGGLRQQAENAKAELQRPFLQEQELAEKSKRLEELNALLNMNEKDIVIDCEPEPAPARRKECGREER